ncbi:MULTISPECIES: hypothetical protein [unclassified Streptomyces]|uniref:hypothetical protein n=1 Tax=unclassified Streptomyces TaxID=2593676 RepID=UPI00226F2E07|nr:MULTISPECIES: hypothetical protein [unclassified Streptomyces]MCY0918295.1 hypothetical protein [Streptomyces sp. H27-G5]MCY0957444.1 hypothetical protein [Streptomyces sp. H27-H5]
MTGPAWIPPSEGAWRARFRTPHAALEWHTVVPAPRMGTRGWARAAASAFHDATSTLSAGGDHWPQAELYELTYLPRLRSRERAIAWAALCDVEALPPFRGSIPGFPVKRPRDEEWRKLLIETRSSYRERLIGYGDGLPDIMGALAGSPQQWDVEAYRDRFGAVNWESVRADIHSAAMSTARQTPYGMLWVDEG